MKDPEELLPLTSSFMMHFPPCSGRQHGYGLMKEVSTHRRCGNLLTGTVYLALQRLEGAGLVWWIRRETPPEGSNDRWTITPHGLRAWRLKRRRLVGLVELAADRDLLSDANFP